MKSLFLVCLILISTIGGAIATPVSIEPRIVGGIPSLAGELPWQLFLTVEKMDGGVYQCGAVYIGNRYALTAAHCVDGVKSDYSSQGQAISVFAGSNDLRDFLPIDSAIEPSIAPIYVSKANVAIHPDYDYWTLENDIAVLELNQEPAALAIKLASAKERRAALNEFDLAYVPGGKSEENLIVSGWGLTRGQDFYSGSIHLLQTALTGVPLDICQNQWQSELPKVICATMPDPSLIRDSCNGDSGGPLIWKNHQDANDGFGLRLLGLVSFGVQACNATPPGGYTDISMYSSFIEQHTTRGLPSSNPNYSIDPFTRSYTGVGVSMPSNSANSGGSLSTIALLLMLLMTTRRYRGLVQKKKPTNHR
ncbi:S1 family peptidase [Vibrio sp. WXL103]|uniref:S1 family peptidase n=1 Tax=Vibrio sp. WXL103 TaxID=3450710 RepID=UPI003EC7516A